MPALVLAGPLIVQGGVDGRDDQDRPDVVRGVHGEGEARRSYRLAVPTSAPPEGAALVVMLHGCTQDGEDFATGTRMDGYVHRLGFLALYPEQPARLHPQRCWRWYEAAHQRRDSGEAAQLAAMIRDVTEERSVDPGRVYVAGMSAGGAMALVLAATHPELFAAAASHSGVAYGAARNQGEAAAAMAGELPRTATLARRLSDALERAGADSLPPLLAIHGSRDEAVDASNYGAIAEAWTTADRSANDPAAQDSTRDLSIHADRWGSEGFASGENVWKRGGRPFVTARGISGLGHAWSGGDPAGSYTDPKGPSATRAVLSFFARTAGDEALDPERRETGSGEDDEPGAEDGATGEGGP